MQPYAPATTEQSNVNIIQYMRHNIPVAILIVMVMLNRYLFEDIKCTSSAKVTIAITFLSLTVIDCIWTTVKCKVDFTQNYPHTGRKWIKYAIIQCCCSLISFYSLNYYIHKGVPFNCYFNYNEVAAELMFYMSFLFISLISYIEHAHWKALPGLDQLGLNP